MNAERYLVLVCAVLWCKDKVPQREKTKEEFGKMADYARIYGISTWNHDQIKGHAEDYIRLGGDCYISKSDYEFLEEILEKENE